MNNISISFINGCPNSDFLRCFLSFETEENPFLLHRNGPDAILQEMKVIASEEIVEKLRRAQSNFINQSKILQKDFSSQFKQNLSPQSFFLLLSGKVYVEFEDDRPAQSIHSLNFSDVWSTCTDTFERNCNLRITGFPQTNILKFKLNNSDRIFNDTYSVKIIKVENTTFNYNLEPNSIAVIYSDQNYYFNGIEIDASTVAEINSKNHNSLELITSNTCYVISVVEK